MAGTPCSATDVVLRSFVLSPATSATATLRPARAVDGPMAVRCRDSAARSLFNFSLMLLCLTVAVASVQRHQHLLAAAQTALDGLVIQEAFATTVDMADLPAMDPAIARVVDPRPTGLAAPVRARAGAAIEPFFYEPQPGESLLDIARRFGVTLASLLWNNEIAAEDEVPAGQKLTVLPVYGVVHRVQAGETPASIAARYGVAEVDLVAANALAHPGALIPGQTLVVRGGSAPLPAAPPASAAARTPPELSIVEDAAAPAGVASTVSDASEAVIEAMAQSRERLPTPKGVTASQRQFILEIAAGARASHRITGVPASVTLAQAILESDWGRSRLARDAKNLFGIKAHSRPGNAGVYTINAWEVLNGADVISPETFKAYKTWADSIVDHGKWFHQQPRYRHALAVRDDPRAFARAINDAGYATDPAYSAKLVNLMERYDLYQYDSR